MPALCQLLRCSKQGKSKKKNVGKGCFYWKSSCSVFFWKSRVKPVVLTCCCCLFLRYSRLWVGKSILPQGARWQRTQVGGKKGRLTLICSRECWMMEACWTGSMLSSSGVGTEKWYLLSRRTDFCSRCTPVGEWCWILRLSSYIWAIIQI